MKNTTTKKNLIGLIVFFLCASVAWAQMPDDYLLDESDFDSEPPGTFVPPPPDFGGPGDFTPPPPVDVPPSNTFTPPPPSGSSPAVNRARRSRPRRPINEAISDEITNENYPDLIDSFDYPNAEIADIIKAISELTGKNFIVDPNVRGKITIMAPSKITVAEAYKAFLSALAINGFSVVPSGKFLKVKPARDAQKDSIETYSGAYSPDTDQMITRIVHLKHISATEVNNKLRGLVTKYGDLNVYEPTNSVIISDFGSNVDKIMSILKELDVAGFEEQLEVIRIRHAKAKDIAELMDKIINKGNTTPGRPGPGGGFTAGIPRFGGVQNQRSSGSGSADAFSLVIPDERTNSIIVVGNKAGIKKIKDLVSKLDRRVTADEAGGVYVYYVKHSDAEAISKTLNGLATESNKQAAGPTPPPSPFAPPVEQTKPLFGGEVKIGFNAETNSLIITASRQDYQVVLNLLRKIDIPRDQVYVEAIILEMNMNNSNQWGINYYKFIGDDDKNVVARGAGFGNGNLGALLTGPGAILGFAQGETLKFNIGGQAVNVKDTMGFVNFLKRVGNVNILSTPQLLAMDNQDAEISVGDKIATGSATTPLGNTTNVSSSPTFEDLEIKLKIKPRISKTDNTVRLELDQSVKQLSNLQNPSETLAQNTVGVAKRALKTNISLSSGDTAVLGGLMQDQEITNEEKVPLLGDIPILGWLFKSKNKSIQKTNMLVLLTPHILRNAHDRNKLLDRKLTERVQFLKDSNGGRDPYGRQLEAVHRKADMAINKQEGATEVPEPEIQE